MVSMVVISVLWIMFWMVVLMNIDWLNSGVIVSFLGSVGIIFGSSVFRFDMILSVDVLLFFRIEISMLCWLFWCMMLVCGVKLLWIDVILCR